LFSSFHRACLIRWFEFKQECPTCRRPCPPPSSGFVAMYSEEANDEDLDNTV
jgi:hypothetical protein